MVANKQLATINKNFGWYARNPSFWDYYSQKHPKVAIVAPPLDSVPSRSGNAIYTLVERMAFLFPEPVIILSRDNGDARKLTSFVDEKVLYTTSNTLDKYLRICLPYWLRKYLWGSNVENVKQYFSLAGKACKELGVEFAILEDEPRGVVSFKKNSPTTKVLLHQHAIAPLGLSPKEWDQVNKLLHGLILVSRKTANQIEAKFGPVPVLYKVIYNGVDLAHFDPLKWAEESWSLRKQLNISRETKVILCVGRLAPEKGVIEALKAFQHSNLKDVRFVIIGETNTGSSRFSNDMYVKELKIIAEQMPGKVILAGMIPQKQLPAWYRMADVLLVPSLGEEGLPKVITEALAMGCMVVATDRGGNWELIRDQENGWHLRNPKDIDEFARLLIQVFSDDQKLLSMKEMVLRVDRPNMDEERMVSEFAAFVHSLRESDRNA